ncbi:MAG: hypothetical protein E6772_06530 [Dysgonomonas sp.]|nr:hypothetical protein [Dysgonomonas sp.]
MKIKDFYELIELEREPDATLLPNLKYRIRKYPFFQPDIFIYIKCLYLSSSDDFAEELARLAPFVSDRKALFYYVMNDRYKQFQKRAEKKLTRNRTDILINAFFDNLGEDDSDLLLDNVVTGPGLATTDYFSYLKTLDQEELVSPLTTQDEVMLEDSLELETEDDIIMMPQVEVALDELEELEESEYTPKLKHQDIIDRFIEKAENDDNLRIHLEPVEETLSEEELDSTEYEGSPEDMENDYFFTETLANIFIKQKKYERAYEIIKHLSLNYPEKNIYFADQLSFLEKLIKNSNKNN